MSISEQNKQFTSYDAFVPWVLAFGIALVLMSTDIYAPSLPAMVVEFAAAEADLQWTLSVNSFGYCLASPFVGPISDALGRRPILIISFACFVVASIGCAIAPTLFLFDVWRFLQGASSAAIPIVSVAVIADMLKGHKFVSMMAYIGIVITLSFALGPFVGGIVAEYHGWRVLFYACAAAGAMMSLIYIYVLPETLPQKTKLSLSHVLGTYSSMLRDPIFLLYGLITSLMLAGFFAYITSSSYLYINEFGLSRPEFGTITSIGMIANAAAHLVVGRITAHFGERKILRFGISLVVTSALTMSWMTFIDVKSAYVLLVPVLIYNMALGFTFPPAMSMAITRFPHATGAASAFLGAVRMILLGSGSYLGGHSYDGTLVSISGLMIFFAGLVVVAFLWVSALREKQDEGEKQKRKMLT